VTERHSELNLQKSRLYAAIEEAFTPYSTHEDGESSFQTAPCHISAVCKAPAIPNSFELKWKKVAVTMQRSLVFRDQHEEFISDLRSFYQGVTQAGVKLTVSHAH